MSDKRASRKSTRRISAWIAAVLFIGFGIGVGVFKLRPTLGFDVKPIKPEWAWPVGGVLIGIGVIFAVSALLLSDREEP